MTSRRLHGDEGASLVLALIFLTVIAVGAAALLTLADTGQRTTQNIRLQGYELYSADGAMDRAILQVRSRPELAVAAGNTCFGTTEGFSETTINGVTTRVRCTPAAGSGDPGAGGASYANMPRNAVLTLAPQGGELGLVQESNNELRITGPVVSNSNVRVNVSSASLDVDGSVKARNGCSPNVTSTEPGGVQCDLGGATIDHSADPGYAMHPSAPAAPPALAPAPQGCPAGVTGARLVRFFPGKYDSATFLNDIFTRCEGGVFHFEPGFYYFDFPNSSTPWRILGSSTRVVGGVPARWSPPNPSPGATGVTVPFPADAIPEMPPNPAVDEVLGGCVTSKESASTPGVQFAFGGLSRVFVQDAKVELCARGSATQQQIAVFGLTQVQDTNVPPPPPPVQQTVLRTSSGPVTSSGEPLYENPDNARGIDGAVARITATQSGNGSTGSLNVPDLTGPGIPADATIDEVRLRVVHRSADSNVSKLAAVLQNAAGAELASVGQAPGNCTAASTNGLCNTPSTALLDQRVKVPGTFTPAVLNAALRLRFDTTLKTSGGQNPVAAVHEVDALELEVLYTPATPPVLPAYSELAGCLVQPLESGGCPLLETVGGPTNLAVHGTFYAPTGALKLELTNVSGQVLGRGVIARTTRVKVTASSGYLGSPIRLPPVTGAPGNRQATFVASQQLTPGGPWVDVLRAVVKFDDTAAFSPERRAIVDAWSVLR